MQRSVQAHTQRQELKPDYPTFNRKFWEEAFAEERLTLEELTPQRTRVAWRFVRELLRSVEGNLDATPLDEIDDEARQDRDPWTHPRERVTKGGVVQRGTGPWELHQLLSEGPVAILPPHAPEPLPEGYDPANDAELVRYVRAIEAVTEHLELREGTPRDQNAGRYGIQGLTDPETVRLAFPSRQALVSFERGLVEEMLRKLVATNMEKAVRVIVARHGLKPHEGQLLVILAKRAARKRLETDPEEERALAILRMESFMDRCRAQQDRRLEFHAFKQLAMIQGLARLEPEDENTAFWKVARGAPDIDSGPPALPLGETGKENGKEDLGDSLEDVSAE